MTNGELAMKAVSEVFDVDAGWITSEWRAKRVGEARAASAMLMRREFRMSLVSIAAELRRKSHCTIAGIIHTLDARAARDELLHTMIARATDRLREILNARRAA